MKKLYALALACLTFFAANAAVGENIYFMGTGEGLSWEAFPGKVVAPAEDGSYQVTITNLTSFKMSTVEATGWDDYNSGAFGFSGSYGDAVYTTAGQTVKLEPWGEDQLMPATGSYTLTINSERTSMVVKANFTKPVEAPAVYLRGLNGNWNATSANKMTYDSATDSYYFNGTIPANQGFKFGDANWGSINYGMPTSMTSITPNGEKVDLAFNNSGKDIKLSEAFTGKVTFKITGTQQAYAIFGEGEVVEPTYPDNLYIIGNVNGKDWGSDNGVKMDNEGDGIYVATGVLFGNAGDDYAYFSFTESLAATWGDMGTRYGAPTNDYVIAVNDEVSIQYGENAFKITGDTAYDIIVSLDDMVVTVEADSSGVESVVTEEAPAVYYNLQGVRVANPTAGQLVIKQQGTTVTKVLVR